MLCMLGGSSLSKALEIRRRMRSNFRWMSVAGGSRGQDKGK